MEATADPPQTTIYDEINAAFATGRRIQPAKVSLLYQLALVLVAIMMVLLPLVYVGIVGLVGWGVYFHATENLSLFDTVGGRAAVFSYVTPLVAGVICFFFLTKPLFARRPNPPRAFVLNTVEEPALELFVKSLCRAVGAPLPKTIELNCDVNAAAAFRRGVGSLFSQDLKLIIGLPLVAGMSLRSFGGVQQSKTGLFDTHPSDNDRIAAAIRLCKPGIFQLDAPATILFRDFEAISQRVTRHYYHYEVELDTRHVEFIDNSVLTGEAEQMDSERVACGWLTGETFHFRRPITFTAAEWELLNEGLDSEDPGEPPSPNDFAEKAAEAQGAATDFGEQSERLDTLLKAQAVLRAGYQISADQLGLSECDLGVVTAEVESTRKRLDALANGDLASVNAMAKQLLLDSIRPCLLAEPGLELSGDKEQPTKEIILSWCRLLELFDRIFPRLLVLREQLIGHGMMLELLAPEGSAESLLTALRNSAKHLRESTTEILSALKGYEHPFRSPPEALITLFEPDIDPTQDPIFVTYQIGDAGMNQCFRLYVRVLGNLAQLAKAHVVFRKRADEEFR